MAESRPSGYMIGEVIVLCLVIRRIRKVRRFHFHNENDSRDVVGLNALDADVARAAFLNLRSLTEHSQEAPGTVSYRMESQGWDNDAYALQGDVIRHGILVTRFVPSVYQARMGEIR